MKQFIRVTETMGYIVYDNNNSNTIESLLNKGYKEVLENGLTMYAMYGETENGTFVDYILHEGSLKAKACSWLTEDIIQTAKTSDLDLLSLFNE